MFEICWRTLSCSFLVKWPWYLASLAQTARHHLFYRGGPAKVPIKGDGFDIVTVAHKEDLFNLRLQARSLAQWLDPAFNGKILIIVNDLDTSRTRKRILRLIVPEYGRWQSHVEVVPFYVLGHGLDPFNGWVLQQALKISASFLVRKPFYLIFDAKNHAIRHLTCGNFVTPSGRGALREGGKPVMPEHRSVCAKYFGLDPEAFPADPCSPDTPFVMHTQSARDLIQYVEAKERRSFFSFFCRTRLLSEFLFYGFYLQANGLADLVHERRLLSRQTVWRASEDLAAAVRDALNDFSTLFFAIHRRILKRLDRSGWALLEFFWRQHRLLRENESARDLLRDFKRAHWRRATSQGARTFQP